MGSPQMLLVVSSRFFAPHRSQIAELAIRHRLPAMFNFSAEEQRPAANDVNQWLAQGLIRPRIDRVLPLAQTAVAHQLQEESTIGKKGTLAGKLVLKP